MTKLAILGAESFRTKPFPLYPTYGKEEEEAILRVLRSNALCAQVGNEVKSFEQAFAEYHKCSYAVAVSSGTTALQVALAAAGVGVGDEVIVPPYTFLATATSVVSQNAIPVFADIETTSLGLDPDAVRKKITSRTKAIIPVCMNGYPCDMESILKIAEKHNLVVIEDCSHAHGAEYRGRKIGTLGHMGAFSFQHKKNMSLGEGGIIITGDSNYDREMRKIRSFSDAPISYNYRMTELHAAIGKVRLAKLDSMNEIRQANAAILDQELKGIDGIKPLQVQKNCKGVYYNYILRYSKQELGVPRAIFIKAVNAEGIPLVSGYTPLHHHPVFKRQNAFGHGCPFRCPLYKGLVDYSKESFPVTEQTCYTINLEVKIHPQCTEKDMLDIAHAIRKVIENIKELKEYAKVETNAS